MSNSNDKEELVKERVIRGEAEEEWSRVHRIETLEEEVCLCLEFSAFGNGKTSESEGYGYETIFWTTVL